MQWFVEWWVGDLFLWEGAVIVRVRTFGLVLEMVFVMVDTVIGSRVRIGLCVRKR